jgi:hypothetical protein
VLDSSPNQGVLLNVCGLRSPLRKAKVHKGLKKPVEKKKKKRNDNTRMDLRETKVERCGLDSSGSG